ncbi:class I SAM-dependent methyltransferase [Nocardioides sp.]|uniref:class I SAM-dependent methyltransferase n=1 Tax=Nocardioides sp. TaxID=35761 RepID=UPI001A233891|nr:class I SAM-dependent methyltransferase [Nocardioides sp.]MBJ7356961.1 class I SAM-dependent methyltransferase [Nocardioides sp.]
MTSERVGRAQVVRRLVAHYDQPRYLEIGVCEGRTFDRVPAAVKVAVDPEFRFDHTAPERLVPGTSYHQITSDEYFGAVVPAEAQFDVIYLDGLHTVEQTLRDLLNALPHLQPQGVLVIDDVRPPTDLAAIRDRQEFFAVRRAQGRDDEKAWMGDVFRLVHFIDTFCQQLSFRVISNNHGQAVVWRHRRPQVRERLLSEVGTLTFEQMTLEEDALRLAPFGEIVRELRADLGLAKPVR